MIIKGRPVFVYDIEVFPNVFLCTCKNTESGKYHIFEISERKNQSELLYEFFFKGRHPRAPMFCGYNNMGYDDIVIMYFLEWCHEYKIWTDFLYSISRFSSNLIKYSNERPEGDNPFALYIKNKCFFSMDLMKMLFPSRKRVNLKFLQIIMGYPDVLEFDGDFRKPLPADRIDDAIKYNINDVDSTEQLLNISKEDIELRLFIEKEWNINCLSMSRPRLAEEYLAKECMKIMNISRDALNSLKTPADTVNLNEIILPVIEYEHPKLQEVLEDMKKQTVSTLERKGYENKFCIRNVVYSVGVGGIHSINNPGIFKPAEDEYIGHWDAVSQYPTTAIAWNFTPQHLTGFRELFIDIRKERIAAKQSHNLLKSKFLKDVLNIPMGKHFARITPNSVKPKLYIGHGNTEPSRCYSTLGVCNDYQQIG